MRRFRLAPHGGQNGARPGFRGIQHGECALGALEGRFRLPGRSVRIGGRAPTQGVRPSAVEVPGARNGQLPLRSRCLPPPSQNPMCAAIGRCASRGSYVSLGGPVERPGRLQLVPIPEEGDFGILEAATGSPSRGSGGWEAHASLGPTAGYAESWRPAWNAMWCRAWARAGRNAGSSWAWAIATGRAARPHPPGPRLALVPYVPVVVWGWARDPYREACAGVQ